MKQTNIEWSFHLFDGEGAGAPDGNSTTTGTSSSEPQQESPRKVQYGRSTGEGQTEGQAQQPGGAQEEDLDAEFAAMIGKDGRYHDAYNAHFNQAMSDRMKNSEAKLHAQVGKIAEDLSPLFINYGIEPGDFEGLKEAIAHDDTFYEAGAQKAGLDVEHYKEMLRLKADSERLARINEAYQNEQARQAKFDEWETDAAALQEAFPNFDLAREIKEYPQFAKLLDSGVDVRTAFLSTHMNEIMTGANAHAEQTATQRVVSQIQQRASRPAEGALSHSPAIQRKSDPSSLTGEDLDEINRRVANGESISF